MAASAIPVIQVRLIGRELLERIYREAPEKVAAALRRALRRAGNLVAKKAKLNLTANRSVNTGVARASIGMQLAADGKSVTIGSNLAGKATAGGDRDYTYFIEHGRKAGRRPPARVLRQWIRRKMGVPEAEVSRVEYFLRKRIGERGTQARPFLVPALVSSEREINAIVQAEVDAELKKLEGR